MPGKKKSPERSFIQVIRKLREAALRPPGTQLISYTDNDILDIDTRIEELIQFFNRSRYVKSTEMICFIMYDIEDHKIRRHIAKYLLKKGCSRVQKSVFVVRHERKVIREMQETLKEVQAMYENNDSIFFLPVGEESIAGMRLVGKNVDFEFALGNRNTLYI